MFIHSKSLIARMSRLLSVSFLLILLIGCGNLEDPATTTPYTLELPAGFPEPVFPENNPLTVEGIALGRKLFYDPILHPEQRKACASCHIQNQSFTSDPEVLPVINLAWSHNFLWEGKVSGTLEDIMRFELTEFFQTDISRLQDDPEYPALFEVAFGNREISITHIEKALAQFLRTVNSGDSKFDRYMRGEVDFTNEELKGFDLFFTERGDCFHCHATVFFTDNLLHNNALDLNPDPGHYLVTSDSLDFGKFKSPTLRNIEYTAPYMHDGRFSTLEEVIDFYSEGLQPSTSVDPLMKQLHQGGVQLSAEEKANLIAFLKTLSDQEFIENPDFSNPQ